LIAGFAIHHQLWAVVPFGLLLVYSGSIKYCPFYHLLKLNNEISRSNEILSQLPKNNPEPVFIFDKTGELVYRNNAAENILPSLTSLADLQGENDRTQFSALQHSSITGFQEKDKSYLLHYKQLPSISSVVAYGFNVTELIQANEDVINTQKELL